MRYLSVSSNWCEIYICDVQHIFDVYLTRLNTKNISRRRGNILPPLYVCLEMFFVLNCCILIKGNADESVSCIEFALRSRNN